MGKDLYVSIWKAALPKILEKIANGGYNSIQMNPRLFKMASINGRKGSGFGFRLEINNAVVPKKQGSAVARDLKEVLDESLKFKSLAKDKNIIIRLGKDFVLEILS